MQARSAPLQAAAGVLPQPAHVIVVIEENHTLAQVIERPGAATYLQQLAANGALLTNAHGVTHPSQPNYLALFAGLTNKNGDGCPPDGYDTRAPNLASELFAAHRTFAGYAEDLPPSDPAACWSGKYARKHVPWVDFTNVPRSANVSISQLPALGKLPTVSFVIPNLDDDMHDGTVQEADAWARAHIAPIVQWGETHDALVVFTWDEGYDATNSIPLLFVGPMVEPGRYGTRADHYDVLRTLEAMYRLPFTGNAVKARTISEIWRR